ncbi:phospholipase effector Tle1 domain-containing protein [Pseudoduganella sp. UC29_106]|uniref:phospholipase effector Tle1 domain-containing protein n=1 Tax=Pseudoduganella sp. UC29_106 TaxID=3374553 RepID=UPI0037566964
MSSLVGPNLKQCVVDVFGFSRGAAEARVFCSWLNEALENGELAGVPLNIRFLGIYDTVASAGIVSSIVAGRRNETKGHDGWAAATSLRICPLVRNCVHMVAMHEFRKNFPLDKVDVAGALPTGTVEVAYPGCHSDLGGGYAPGELGVSTSTTAEYADSLKLSQLPLNHMLECARACGTPLNKKLAIDRRNGRDPFQVASQLATDFDGILKSIGSSPKRLLSWGNDYLSWRWHVRNSYTQLSQYKNAAPEAQKLMLEQNNKLIRDAKLLLEHANLNMSRRQQREVLVGNSGVNNPKNAPFYAGISHLDPVGRAKSPTPGRVKIPHLLTE